MSKSVIHTVNYNRQNKCYPKITLKVIFKLKIYKLILTFHGTVFIHVFIDKVINKTRIYRLKSSHAIYFI